MPVRNYDGLDIAFTEEEHANLERVLARRDRQIQNGTRQKVRHKDKFVKLANLIMPAFFDYSKYFNSGTLPETVQGRKSNAR